MIPIRQVHDTCHCLPLYAQIFCSHKLFAMNIEIHSIPSVPEEVVSLVKVGIMEFKRLNKNISRTEVSFREAHTPADNKICEIRLNIFGDSLYTMRKAQTFKRVAGLALRHLGSVLKKQLSKGKSLSEEVVSSVKV